MGQDILGALGSERLLLCRYEFISEVCLFYLLNFPTSTIHIAGVVTPVVHYCMGGITINEQGQVLNRTGGVMKGLLAAGEIIGGLHGRNRLGGRCWISKRCCCVSLLYISLVSFSLLLLLFVCILVFNLWFRSLFILNALTLRQRVD
jgi:hypothetical protein